MALEVRKETDTGDITRYIKLRDFSVNNEKKIVSFSLYGYKDKETRDNKKAPNYTKSYEVKYEDINYTTKEEPFGLIFKYVKNLKDDNGVLIFEGAIDLD